MATLADATADVRTLLQDSDSSQYVWPTVVLQMFLNEGVRRLSPDVFLREAVTVASDGTANSFSLSTDVGAGVIAVEGVLSTDFSVGAWEVYGDSLLFADILPVGDFDVRVCREYASIDELPAVLVDAVKYFAAARAMLWLLNRGGSALHRYLASLGDLAPAEVQGIAEAYMREWMGYRDEHSTSTFAFIS